jgi:predicted transposase YbfD/YdcC
MVVIRSCLSAKEFAKLIREHWWCENKNHYPKDTAFNEDGTTKRIGAFNFSILISIALNIMRINKSENIRGDLYLNTMHFNRMMSMMAYL